MCFPSFYLAIPPKVEEAFRLFHYIPYTLLSVSACVKATHGEDKVMLTLSGGVSVKSLDQHNKNVISVVEWCTASCDVEERTHFHHGNS